MTTELHVVEQLIKDERRVLGRASLRLRALEELAARLRVGGAQIDSAEDEGRDEYRGLNVREAILRFVGKNPDTATSEVIETLGQCISTRSKRPSNVLYSTLSDLKRERRLRQDERQRWRSLGR